MKITRSTVLLLVCFVGSLSLSGCWSIRGSLERMAWDGPVSFLIIMHEDGWCKPYVDGRLIETKHVMKFERAEYAGGYHYVWCSTPNPSERREKMEVRFKVDDDEVDSHFGWFGNSRETRVIHRINNGKFDPIKLYMSIYHLGPRSGSGGGDTSFLSINEYIILNVGADKKMHIAFGEADRI